MSAIHCFSAIRVWREDASIECLLVGSRMPAAVGVDAAQIAERILKFCHDETLSREVAQAGLTFIAAGFGEQTVSDLLKAAIEGRRAPVDAGSARRA